MRVLFFSLLLLAAVGWLGYYWYQSWVREQIRVRLSEDVERQANVSDEQKPFARRHYIIPWIVAAIVGVAVWFLFNFPIPIACGVAIVVGLLAMEVDAWILEWRQGQLEAQLADIIDTLVSSVGAGSSLQGALTQAAEYAPAPIKFELDELVGRLRLGDAPTDVFDLLRQRVPMETFGLFTTTLAVNWEVGGSLSETLAAIGLTIRDRMIVSRQIRALSVQGRLTTITVLAITWFMAAMMWQSDPPRFYAFVLSPMGIALMATVLVLQGVGIAMVSKISRPKV